MEWFIPDDHREYVVGDLCKQDLSSVTYVAKGLEHLIILVASQIRPAFSLKLYCAEGAALAVGFAGVPKDQGFFIAISAGLAGLVLRDAYVYPKKDGPFHQGADTLVALVFIIAIEIFETLVAPSHALPGPVLGPGLALSLLTLSMVRVILRRPPSEKPFGTASYRMTRFTWQK